jgi:acetyl-CoA carboxylase biotin carboxylase subunit
MNTGSVEILGERECSIQRRHQKLLEESPSPALNDGSARRNLSGCKKRFGGAVHQRRHSGVPDGRNGQPYFIEVNARVQVEHPVTELVTGIDIVKSQIRIAQGERCAAFWAVRCDFRGHAIECRINAENPETFAPSPGRITGFHLPGGDRRPCRHVGLSGLGDSALLRLAGGQADRSWATAPRPSSA